MTRRRAAALVLLGVAAAVAAQPPAPPAAARELHVVAIYEPIDRGRNVIPPATVPVRVDRPGKDIALIVSAYEPTTWEVTAGPKTKVEKVILAGHYRQTAKVPEGAEVVEAFYEGRPGKEHFTFVYKIDTARFRPSVRAAHKLTRQEVRSFQGSYRYDPARPFVVDAVQDEPRLSTDYPKPDPAADLPKVRFAGVLTVAADRFRESASWGEFTQAGPDRATFKPLPDRITALAHDPVGKKYSGVGLHEIHEVDIEKRTSTKLDPGAGVPRISWPVGITFDTKRDRLIVATVRGEFYTYTPKTGAWAVLAHHRGVQLAAVAYRPEDDSLYALGERGGSDGSPPILYQFNAGAAHLRTTELGPPMFPGLAGHVGLGGGVCLAAAGDQLAVVASVPADREIRIGNRTETFLYLIDPKTDKVRLAWKE